MSINPPMTLITVVGNKSRVYQLNVGSIGVDRKDNRAAHKDQ